MSCYTCSRAPAVVIRPSNRDKLCKVCFLAAIEMEVHQTVLETDMFKGVRTLVVGVSGGKDSTVLASILALLNQRYEYGLDLKLLCIDEGIAGYRDKSIAVVKQNEQDLGLPLLITSYQEKFKISMDGVVAQIGRKNNCTYCGVFRRGSLEDGARELGGDMIATGHNADDLAETVIMNYLRGDISRLVRCTKGVTDMGVEGVVRRCKPLMRVYEKEIVMYAFYRKLPYFSTECKYSPGAFRGVARTYIKSLEKQDPAAIKLIIKSGDLVQRNRSGQGVTKPCSICARQCSGSSGVCKACLLLKTLDITNN
ncbi:cytoplasmic tRNA 2-thiolation protein 1 [Nematocida homosporus]|uniref:cytoplasmic tRNA 2-thiolation protein 1 n=1 Tax=Nematocida homosporus TaxID=1912981 RepID=UPI00221F3880|nr:cytoplasmic tRNA 2-thiolation protein 1 [Nematocida homosporus]KAI5184628.1 cytoplasmic tRNA 2-thiolation protein 1 [Nematocida homosporus]